MKRPCETRYSFTPREEGNTEELCVKLCLRSIPSVPRTPTTPVAVQSFSSESFSTVGSPNMSSTRQLSGVWAKRAEVLRPPLEGRDTFEYPSPTSSQTSDYATEQFRHSLSISNHQPPAKRSLSDNMSQAAVSSSHHHPLPPPQRHSGGYYSQSSSSSSQGSYRGGGGQQQTLQGAWATPGKTGAAVVQSSRNPSSSGVFRDLSQAVGSGGSSSPMFSLSRHSSTSSLCSSGSVTPGSSGTRTPNAIQHHRNGRGPLELISSSASKLEKLKRDAAARDSASRPQWQQQSGRSRGAGGGYTMKHSVSGPVVTDMGRMRRVQSQQFQRDSMDGDRTPRRNVSSQNLHQTRDRGRSTRPLSDSFGAQQTATRNDYGNEFHRSYSESQKSPGARRANQPSTGKFRGQSSRGRGGRGRGYTRNS